MYLKKQWAVWFDLSWQNSDLDAVGHVSEVQEEKLVAEVRPVHELILLPVPHNYVVATIVLQATQTDKKIIQIEA